MLSYVAKQMQKVRSKANLLTKAITSAAALDEYLGATVIFVVIGVTVAVGAYVLQQVQSQIGNVNYVCGGTPCTGANVLYGNAYNAAGNAVTGISTFGQWLPILAIVLVATVIIALLYSFFRGGGEGGSKEAPVNTGELEAA